MTIKKIIIFYLVLNLTISLCALLIISEKAFINLQVAFWSSFFIIIGSSFGYLRNLKKRISLCDIEISAKTRDNIDMIDDKFDLYSDINEKENLTKEEIHNIIKEEKSKIKLKDTFKNTFQTIGATSSIYRIIGYLCLIVGFFYLRNNDYLEPLTYLLGFLIIPIIALIIQYKQKNINFE